jgi:putative ABC transport system permease protein
METLWKDIRHGFRTLAKTPGITLVAVLALALGIGANTAIFSVVNGVLLRPLPYPEPDRLVVVFGTDTKTNTRRSTTSLPDYTDLRIQNQTLEEAGTLAYWTFNLTGRALPERLVGARVSGSFFSVLQARPLLGRTLTPADDTADAADSVVISYPLWQKVFAGDPDIIGQAITLNSVAHTVVGVMPESFQFPDREVLLWGAIEGNLGGVPRGSRFMQTIARLKNGVALETAQADLDTIAARLAVAYPESNKDHGFNLVPFHETVVGNVRAQLLLLTGAVGLVLLIACANVVNLLLLRAAARRREFAIRAALGAGRGRLMRQLITESLTLAVVGGTLALLLAHGSLRALVTLQPEGLPRLEEISLDWTVFSFALGITLLAGIVAGLFPALHVIRGDLMAPLKDGLRTSSEGRGGLGLRNLLVTAEIAMAVVLLIGSGLLVRSFQRILSVDPGFQTQNLLSMQFFLTGANYRSIPQQKTFVEELLREVRTLPGVEDAQATSRLPLTDTWTTLRFQIEGRVTAIGEDPLLYFQTASPGYFRLMGIPLLQGRTFAESDNEDSAPVLIINREMARRFWPGESPVGRRLRWSGQSSQPGWHTIVGVVGNVKGFGYEAEDRPAAYTPIRQRRMSWLRWGTLVLRTRGDHAGIVSSVRETLQRIDPNQPVYGVTTMETLLKDSLAQRRFLTSLIGLFGGVALLLAAIGTYGVIAYTVSQRVHEIGIRKALGAQNGEVLRMVLRQGLTLALTGIALGAVGALALNRFLASQLFGITPNDPVTFAGITFLLIAVALLACLIPARRAANVDPIIALRAE